jgi:hypothetical protein
MKTGLKIAVLGLVLIFSDCKKKSKDPVEDPAPTPAPAPVDINHVPTILFTIDGTSYSYSEGTASVANWMGTSKELNTTGGPSSTAYSSGFGTDTKSYWQVTKSKLVYNITNPPDEAAFRQFFSTGMVNYAPSGPGQMGIVIDYWDANGKSWSSNNVPADQTGSVFTIESVKEFDSDLQDQQMKVYATFNCKVYDLDGNAKTLANGKFVGYFENN